MLLPPEPIPPAPPPVLDVAPPVAPIVPPDAIESPPEPAPAWPAPPLPVELAPPVPSTPPVPLAPPVAGIPPPVPLLPPVEVGGAEPPVPVGDAPPVPPPLPLSDAGAQATSVDARTSVATRSTMASPRSALVRQPFRACVASPRKEGSAGRRRRLQQRTREVFLDIGVLSESDAAWCAGSPHSIDNRMPRPLTRAIRRALPDERPGVRGSVQSAGWSEGCGHLKPMTTISAAGRDFTAVSGRTFPERRRTLAFPSRKPSSGASCETVDTGVR